MPVANKIQYFLPVSPARELHLAVFDATGSDPNHGFGGEPFRYW
jgi:hypothetical protein